MSSPLSAIAGRIAELERELERRFDEEFAEKQKQFRYSVEKGRIAFDSGVGAIHERLRKNWVSYLWDMPRYSLLVSPVIYSLTVPLLMLDAWLWLYQAVCFPVYGIEKVERSQYILLDRGRLRYLNWLERFNCNYCGYANGLVAYAREVSSRTEQYFCPIKHATRLAGASPRYQEFADFGDAQAYRDNMAPLREELKKPG
ncbi:MAG: hypothetical protein PHS14_10795 [Elusimicrobia bacterium]|nr:hypothetical protein [Elusimicrobiota bacterium]